MKTKVIVAGLVTASLILAVFLSGGTVVAEETKIGIMQALTGDLGTYGGPMTDAMKLAVKEVNENGGVLNGHAVKLVLLTHR